MSATTPDRLDGKVAIITGAGQGGGMGCALALAEKGARLALFGRTLAKLDGVADQIRAAGGQAITIGGDVTCTEDRLRLVNDAVAEFGRIDILINTAQSPDQRDCPMLETSREMLDDLWQSGFIASFELMRLCHPHMKQAGGGSIVNFCSGAQMKPGNFTGYAGVKAAIQTMSRGAAEEWGPDNIRVNCVFPLVKSPAYDLFEQNNPELHTQYLNTIPLRRVGDPEDIGWPVAFLVSEQGRFITGATLPLDGGSAFLR